MKGMIQLKHSRITIAIITFVAILSISGMENHSHANPKFREFKTDEDRFERHIETAESAAEASVWQKIVLNGKALLKADWEKDADLEIERVIREEGGDDAKRQELIQQKEVALAEWEGLIDAYMAKEEGKWYAARQNILYADLDREKIQAILSETIDNVDIKELEDWDSSVFPEVDKVNDAWGQELNTVLSDIRKAGDALDAKVRESYLTEITRIEEEIRDAFRIEKNTLVYRARNKYILDTLYDSNSLRTQSESESGEAVADRIITETEDSLSAEEAKLLHDGTTAEGSGDVDFSKLGDNWEQELSRLIENGMGQWNRALDQLYGEMRDWRGDAQSVYDTGDDQWRKAYDKLYQARDAWYKKISEEINKGIESWKERENDLNQNLDQARADFQKYIVTLNDQWADHSMGLREMVTTGASIYGESRDNIAWLEKMTERYDNQAAFENNSDELINLINSETDNQIQKIIDTWPEIEIPVWGSTIKTQWVDVSATNVSMTWDADKSTLTEVYRVVLVKNNYTPATFSLFGSGKPAKHTQTIVSNFTWTNIITDEVDGYRKSADFIYTRELDRWKELQKRFEQLVTDTETNIHDKNMLGDPDGPGFLTDNGKDGDPYLMTDAEQTLRLAKKEKEYWERRLAVSQAVKAYAETIGKRESAEETIARKEIALSNMNQAKESYNKKLSEVSVLVNQLKEIQGTQPPSGSGENTITYLTNKLEGIEKDLKIAEDEFLAKKRAVILLENQYDISFVEDEIEEIEQNLVHVEKSIRDKSFEYYTVLRDAEQVRQLSAYANLYKDVILKREAAGSAQTALTSIIKGVENDKNVSAWIAELDGQKEAIWGDDAAARYGKLKNSYDAYTAAESDEKAEAWQKLSYELRREYNTITSAYAIYDKQYTTMRDDDLDVQEFLDKSNTFDIDVYHNTAKLNRDAFILISDTFETIESNDLDKDYSTLIGALKAELDNYTFRYGDDNDAYAVRYSAYTWATANLSGLNEENFASLQQKVADEEDAADAIEALYNSYDAFDASLFQTQADNGNETARTILMEYYNRGSSLLMLPELSACDSKLQINEAVNERAYQFVSEHETTLAYNKTETLNANHTEALYTFLAANSGITITEESIETLDADSLATVAGYVQSYIQDTQSRGAIVPESIQELGEKISALHENLVDHLYLQEHAGEAVTDVMVHEKQTITDEFEKISSFISDAKAKLELSSEPAPSIIDEILASYKNLSDSERNRLLNIQDPVVAAFISKIENFKAMQFDMEKRTLAIDFVSAANALDVTQFVNARCGSMSDAEKDEIRGYLAPYSEKRKWLESSFAGTLADYLDDTGITGDVRQKVRSFALVQMYRQMTETGNYSGADPAFSDFVASKKTEDLPDEVQYLLAARSYYTTMYDTGGYLLTGSAIDDYIDGIYGTEGISATASSRLKSYIENMGTIDRYLGQDLDTYLGGLSDEDMDLFLNYYLLTDENGNNEALMPGFKEGYLGDLSSPSTAFSRIIKAEQDILAGRYELAIPAFLETVKNASETIEKNLTEAARESRQIKKLQEYNNSPELFNNYRNFVITAQVEKAQTDPDADPLFETIIDTEDAGNNLIYDQHNDETDHISVIYRGTEEEDGSSLHSLILEDCNELAKELRYLFKTSGKQVIETNNTVAGFLDRADAIYSQYIGNKDIDSLKTGITGLVSEYDSLRVGLEANATSLASEVNTLTDTSAQYKENLMDRGATYRLLDTSTGGIGAIQNEMAEAAENRRIIEDQYTQVQDQILALQKQYNEKNTSYIDTMNEAATLYKTFQEQEFAYEKAYAVWEYANTPYLNKESNTGSENDTTTNVADAKENYNRIKGYYDTAEEAYTKAQTAVSEQKTVQDLHSEETEYMEARNEFSDKTKSYTRTAHTDILLNEDIAKLSEAEETARLKVEAVMAELNGSIFKTDDMTKEKALIRDTLIDKFYADGEASLNMYLFLAEFASNKRNGVPLAYTYWWSGFSFSGTLLPRNDSWNALSTQERNQVNSFYSGINMYNYDDYTAKINTLKEDGKNEELVKLYEPYQEYLSEKLGSWANDMDLLYDNFDPVLFNQMTYYHNQASHWDRMVPSCSRTNLACRRRARRRRNWRSTQINNWNSKRAESRYKFKKFSDARTALEEATANLNAIAKARSVSEIQEKLKTGNYKLTEEELSLVYDGTFKTEDIPENGININALRKEVKREDAFGRPVKAIIEGDTVYILSLGGKKTGETFSKDDITILLRDASGDTISSDAFQENIQYTFSDYIYNVSEISRVIKNRIKEQRDESKVAMETLTGSLIQSKRIDSTLVLRDQETLHWNLLTYARDLGKVFESTDPNTNVGEFRQRSFDGYQTVLSELVHNGSTGSPTVGGSVQDKIVNAMVAQNKAQQELLWTQKTRQFNEKRDRWLEVVNYIVNRGASDWTSHLNRIDNEWRKWRLDTRDAIEEGEKQWEKALGQFKGEMKSWQESTSDASANAATAKMFSELTDKINGCMNDLRENLPGNFDLQINADKILADAFINTPVDSIGILSESMEAFDTTAGFDTLMTLNLSGALEERFNSEMKTYTNRMLVMKNMRVIDILDNIIEQFNEQVKEQNKASYDQVDYAMRPHYGAPFQRGGIWAVQYVRTHSLIGGTKRSIYQFSDYKDIAIAIPFKKLKGYNGSEIDFNDPTTYMNIDFADLEIYVRLEQDYLETEIENIFGKDGTFTNHVTGEFNRLSAEFNEGQGRYDRGQALLNGDWYRTSLWKGGFNIITAVRTIASIVASYCSGGAGGVAVNALFTGIDVADGTLNYAHGGVQLGVAFGSAVAGGIFRGGDILFDTFAQGIEYEEGGAFDWSWSKVGYAAKGNVARYAVKGLMMYATKNKALSEGVTAAFMSGYSTRGNAWEFKWDYKNTTEHLTAGLATGLSTWVSSAGENSFSGEAGETSIGAGIGNSNNSPSVPNVIFNDLIAGTPMMGDLTSGAIYSSLMTGMYHATGGKGFKNNYYDYDWNSLVFDHKDIGNALGNMLVDGLKLKKYGDAATDWTLGLASDIGESMWNLVTGDGWNTDAEVIANNTRDNFSKLVEMGMIEKDSIEYYEAKNSIMDLSVTEEKDYLNKKFYDMWNSSEVDKVLSSWGTSPTSFEKYLENHLKLAYDKNGKALLVSNDGPKLGVLKKVLKWLLIPTLESYGVGKGIQLGYGYFKDKNSLYFDENMEALMTDFREKGWSGITHVSDNLNVSYSNIGLWKTFMIKDKNGKDLREVTYRAIFGHEKMIRNMLQKPAGYLLDELYDIGIPIREKFGYVLIQKMNPYYRDALYYPPHYCKEPIGYRPDKNVRPLYIFSQKFNPTKWENYQIFLNMNIDEDNPLRFTDKEYKQKAAWRYDLKDYDYYD